MMKVLVVLALMGMVAAGKSHSFCRGKPQARADATAARLFIATYLPTILRHCPAAVAAINARHAGNAHCSRVFDEGYCYASNLYSTYGVDEMLSECTYGEAEGYMSVTATFEDIADVLRPRSDVLKLGRLACQHGLPCFEHIVIHLAQCSANDGHFYETALDNARGLIEPLIGKYSGSFEDFLICHFGEDSDLITLLKLVQKRITSFEDIVDLLNTYVSKDMQDKLIVDIKAGVRDFIEVSKHFCSADCVRKSANFFRGVFDATHDEDTCPTIDVYCGECQANTDQYLMDTAGSVPCCTQDALDSIVGSIQSIMIEYGDMILELEAAAREAVSGAGIETDEYEEVMESAWEQVECLGDSYEVLAEGGCSPRA